MADQDARALLLTIQANTELLRSNLSAAERSIEEFTKKTEEHLEESDAKFELFGRSLEKLEGPLERLKQLGEIAGVALLGESLLEAGKKGLEFAGNVKFVSEQVGTSTDFLQKYRYAAGQFGVSTEAADEGLNKFARSVGETANGNKELTTLFDRLGVKVRDAGGNVRSVEAVFLDTAAAISKVESPAEKSADVLALMGKSAAPLIPLLSAGADGFSSLAQAADRLGVVLSPELIEHSEEVNHKLTALKQVVNAQMSSAIAQNASAIESLATSLVSVAGAIAHFLAGHPERALAILGGLAGARIGGLPGAAIGATVGGAYGLYLDVHDRNETTEPDVRREQLQKANEAYKVARTAEDQHGSAYAPLVAQARATLAEEFGKYQAALKIAGSSKADELGSTAAGFTNKSDADLKAAQAKLVELEKDKAGASGDALKAYNEEIVGQKRKIAFIKQGADAELASSLAAKQAGAERKGESAAKEAKRKAEEAARKALEQQERALAEDRAYQGEVSQADAAIAKARLKLADTADARYQIAVKELRDALRTRDNQIDDQIAAHKLDPTRGITEQQGLLLKVKAGSAEVLGEQGAANDLSDTTEKQRTAVSTDALQRDEQHLQILDQLATTAAARRDVELRILKIQEEAERQALTAQRDTTKDQAEKDRIQKQIDALPDQYADRAKQTAANTRGPGEQFRAGLDGKSLSEDLDQVKVNAIEDLGNSFDKTAEKALKLHGILGQIAADLIKLAIEREVEKPIADALFPTGVANTTTAAGSAGGIFGSILKIFGGGRAVGGGVNDNQFYLVGEKGPELFAPGASGTIIPNHELVAPRVAAPYVPSAEQIGRARQSATQVAIAVQANDYFDAKVSSISGGQIQQAAPRIANGGAQLSAANAARRQRRQLS